MGNQGRVGDRFRKRLKSERQRRDWSQEDVAKMLADKGIHGIYPTTIAKIEAGDRAVRIDELTAIADLLDVSLDGLLGRLRRPGRDLTSTLQDFADTARLASVQLSTIEESLEAKAAEVAAFEFEGRDQIIEGCDWVRDVLAKAGEVLLATTMVKSEDLQLAATKRWFDEMVHQMQAGGSDEA